MYIFTLMGMQFFAGKLKFNDDDQLDSNGRSVRYNFDTFPRAFLSVFILLTGENWNEMMYNAMRATSNFASIYFIIVMILGNFIIVQLLVAIVITNFDKSHKFTQKRKIINEIEANLKLGKSIIKSIGIVLGEIMKIEHHEENENNDAIKFSRKILKKQQVHFRK